MNLSDLKNDHYAVAVREAMMELILGRSDNIVKVGDVVEMLLSISFAVKDSMLDWQWLGINPQEWPPQRLDWEMYRLEHLAFASNMEEQMAGWIEYPWHVLYSALRCLACQDWKRPHSCPICRALTSPRTLWPEVGDHSGYDLQCNPDARNEILSQAGDPSSRMSLFDTQNIGIGKDIPSLCPWTRTLNMNDSCTRTTKGVAAYNGEQSRISMGRASWKWSGMTRDNRSPYLP